MTDRVVLFRTHGDESVLEVVPTRPTAPPPGWALVQVRACAVNHLDLEIRSGMSRMEHSWPHVLGREAVGTVVDIGPLGADDAPIEATVGSEVVVSPQTPCGTCVACRNRDTNLCGQSVMPGITHPGGYATHILAPVRGLIPLDGVDPVIAAATPISFGTAWRMLVSIAAIRPDETVLVTGAAGALGSAAVQVAALCGARVIAAASSAEKLAFATGLGASEGINYSTTDLTRAVRELTNGRGVDVAVEHTGGAILTATIAAMANRGRVVTAGGHGGEIVDLDIIPFFRAELSLVGSRSQRPDEIATVLELVRTGRLAPTVAATMPLDDVGAAHRAVADRAVMGKIVLVP